VSRRLNLPLTPVMPAHLCPLPGPLYTVLMGYKESPVEEGRRRFAGQLGRLFDDFFAAHRDCVAAALGGPVDLVLPVPSSSRPGPSPLERVPGLAERAVSVRGVGGCWAPWLLRRGEGPIGHMRPNAAAFAVPPSGRPELRGSRVLLLDDTYVSGSRAQSAAAALRLAGATSTLIVPLGRVLRPARFRAHAALVDAAPARHGHPPG
jgi:hypothetical protein